MICFELQCSEEQQTAHTTIFPYTIDGVPFWMRYYMRGRAPLFSLGLTFGSRPGVGGSNPCKHLTESAYAKTPSGLELCCDQRPSICVSSKAIFRLETCRDALHLARGYIFHALHRVYFHAPAGVHGQARAPEPATPERAGLPPRRRRACDSPKSRTACRQPHPPQPSGLTPTSAFAAASAQPTRFPGQASRHSRPLVHGG